MILRPPEAVLLAQPAVTKIGYAPGLRQCGSKSRNTTVGSDTRRHRPKTYPPADSYTCGRSGLVNTGNSFARKIVRRK